MKSLIKITAVAMVIGAMALEALALTTSNEKFVDRIVKKQEHLFAIAQNREELMKAVTNVLSVTESNASDKMFLVRIQKKSDALVSMQSSREEFAGILGKPLVSDARFADRLAYKADVMSAK